MLKLLDAHPTFPLRPLFLLSLGFVSLLIVKRAKDGKLPQLSHLLRKKLQDTIHGTDIRISRILVYPIKSCAGIELQSCEYDQEGFEFDRKWMIVDLEKNKQMSARDNRGIKLVRIIPSIKRDSSSPYGGVLEVTFPDSTETLSFSVPLDPTPDQLSTWDVHQGCLLWGFSCEGYVCQSADPKAIDTPSEILSEFVGRPVLLIMKSKTQPPRRVDEFKLDEARLAYEGGPTVRFPDASPFLLCSEASIRDAEAKVQAMARGEYERKVAGCKPDDAAPPVTEWALPGTQAKKLLIERFRPNIVVSGVNEPYGEDDWQEITTKENHTLLLPARCPRCMFPNVDTESGKRDPEMPNNAMMQYRKVDAAAPSKYCFGMYTVPGEDNGVLKVGDRIMVTRSAVNPKLPSE